MLASEGEAELFPSEESLGTLFSMAFAPQHRSNTTLLMEELAIIQNLKQRAGLRYYIDVIVLPLCPLLASREHRINSLGNRMEERVSRTPMVE